MGKKPSDIYLSVSGEGSDEFAELFSKAVKTNFAAPGMKYSQKDLLDLIQIADTITPDQRLDLFSSLAKSFSLVPLVGGFPKPGENPRRYKKPIEYDWSQWCKEKRPFNRADFSPERAGIACGPASGVLVLDVDNMDRYNKWLAQHGVTEPLPTTFTVKTGGVGERYHYYFKYPLDGKKYSNRSVEDTFDIRGLGGQVLCPGSLHPVTRKPYTIAVDTSFADAPAWVANYSFHKSVNPPGQSASKQKEPDMSPMPPSDQQIPEVIPGPPDPFVETLPVSIKIKELIVTSFPKEYRSEPSMTVLVGLLSAEVDMQTIQHIYDTFPVGEKAREDGPAWLSREIEKAKEYIAAMQSSPQAASKPKTPQAPQISYTSYSALDVATKPVQFEFLIDKFWPKGEPLMITGPGGAGKSIMTLQIAMDLAFPPTLGFLDTFKVMTKPVKTLFIQSENTFVGIKKRIADVRAGYQIADAILNDNIFFLGVGNDIRTVGDMMESKFTDVIKAHVMQHKAEVLVIDPLISFHSKDENSNDQMRRLLDQVAMFCEEIKVSPLLIHHHSKYATDSGSGGGRGASAIGDWSPNNWELKYTKKSGFELSQKKARNFRIMEDKLDLELDHLRFKPKKSSTATNTQLAADALRNLGGKSSLKKDLKEAIVKLFESQNPGKTMATGTAGNRIKEAIASGEILETLEPGGKSKVFTLPQ